MPKLYDRLSAIDRQFLIHEHPSIHMHIGGRRLLRGRRAATSWVAEHAPELRVDRERLWAAMPPALVLTAEYDPLRDEGKDYADRLRAAGVNVTYRCHAGMVHGFVSLGRVIPQASAAIRECAEAVANALR